MRTPAPVDFSDVSAVETLHPLLAQLQTHDPVAWSDQLNGWIITRYEDVAAALRNPALSSQRVEVMVRSQVRNGGPSPAPDYERITRTQMLFRDGAEHHRLRVLGNRGFTPTSLERARPLIQKVVDGLIDRVAAHGEMDLVRDFSQPLPALVIAELFGIPEADRAQFQAWGDDVALLTGFSQGDPQREAHSANEAMRSLEAYFLNLLQLRGKQTGDDLMSLLVAGQAEGRLTAEEVCSQCILILVAGHITTIDQLANSVYALLTHRDQWEHLCRDPSRAAGAVEETLRFDPSVVFIHRKAVIELEIGGQTIHAGEAIWLSPAAANRDPAVFADPDRFDIERSFPHGHHLSFGAGPHVCLGAGLARRELEIALATLARRLPKLRLRDPSPRRRCASLVFRGFHTLPVAF